MARNAAAAVGPPNSRLFIAASGTSAPSATTAAARRRAEHAIVATSAAATQANHDREGMEKNVAASESVTRDRAEPFISTSEHAPSTASGRATRGWRRRTTIASAAIWASVRSQSHARTAVIVACAPRPRVSAIGQPRSDEYCAAKSPDGVMPERARSISLKTVEEPKRSMIPPENWVIDGR